MPLTWKHVMDRCMVRQVANYREGLSAMDLSILPAKASHQPDPVANLIWTVDPPLMKFLFGTEERWRRVFSYDWSETEGIVCHEQTTLAMQGEDIVGVLVSHTIDEFDEHFVHTRARQGRNESPAFRKHLDHAFDLMAQLFPHGLEGSYFIFDLAVSSKARRMGIGRRLIDVAKAKARDTACKQICLDVAADNDAVQFYEKIGMRVAVETRVPELDQNHGVGTHYHMVLPV